VQTSEVPTISRLVAGTSLVSAASSARSPPATQTYRFEPGGVHPHSLAPNALGMGRQGGHYTIVVSTSDHRAITRSETPLLVRGQDEPWFGPVPASARAGTRRSGP
jgi:hypothetical protein